MSESKTNLEKRLSEELAKYKGAYVPAKASLLRRALVRSVSCKKMHPNPNDEFCDPHFGPNQQIIARYADEIRHIQEHPYLKCFDEPIIIEKIHPDGYMILNGHHRWAAAVRMSQPRLRVQVVNLTQASDIEQMLQNVKHQKRVTLDLDEVVFQREPGEAVEKKLPFPLDRIYKERLRRGIPALFHFLKTNGYDIWVYSKRYYSTEYIQMLFKCYHVQIDGIVTGTGRKAKNMEAQKKKLQALIAKKYPLTIHIDRHSLLCISGESKDYMEYPLTGNEMTWSQEIMNIIGALEKP